MCAQSPAALPLHLLQSAVGCLVWACYLTGTSMLTIRHSLRHLAYHTSLAAKGTSAPLPPPVAQEWNQAADALRANLPHPLCQQPLPYLPTELTTDSSSYAAAAVFTTDGEEKVQNWWWSHPQHINCLELASLGVALNDYPWPADDSHTGPTAMRWTTDNTVSERVVKKMYSKSKPLQDILLYIQAILDLHDCTVYPEWISTHLNVTADRGSREVSSSAPVLNPTPPFAVSTLC